MCRRVYDRHKQSYCNTATITRPNGTFFLSCTCDIPCRLWVLCMCFLLCIHVRMGSVFCLHNSGGLCQQRLSCCRFGCHLLNGVGCSIVGCRICDAPLAVSRMLLCNARTCVLLGVFLGRRTVRSRHLVAILAIPSSLRGCR